MRCKLSQDGRNYNPSTRAVQRVATVHWLNGNEVGIAVENATVIKPMRKGYLDKSQFHQPFLSYVVPRDGRDPSCAIHKKLREQKNKREEAQTKGSCQRQTERGAYKGPNGLFLRFWNQMTVQKFKRPTRMDASGLWCTSDEDSWGAEGDSGEDFNVGATYTQRPRAGAQSARR